MKGHLKLRLKDSLTNLNLNHYSCSVGPIGNGRKVLKKQPKKHKFSHHVHVYGRILSLGEY